MGVTPISHLQLYRATKLIASVTWHEAQLFNTWTTPVSEQSSALFYATLSQEYCEHRLLISCLKHLAVCDMHSCILQLC